MSVQRSHDTLRIAWFSSCSITRRLKSAAFTRAVLPALLERSDIAVDVFATDEDLDELSSSDDSVFVVARGARSDEESAHPETPTSGKIPVRSVAGAFHRHRAAPFDIFFYQLEDHPAVSILYRHHQLWPGLTLFHDLNLNALHLEQFRFNTAATDLNRAMDRMFGSSSARLGDYLVRGWSLDAFDPIYPAGMDCVRDSAKVLVSTLAAQRVLARKKVVSQICVFPQTPVDPVRSGAERESLRRMIDLPKDARVIGFSGAPRLADRAPQVLEAFERLQSSRSSDSPILLWIVRPDVNESAVESFVESHLSRNTSARVALLSASSEAELAAFHSIPDLLVDTAADPMRSPGLTLWYGLARGVPTVVSSLTGHELIERGAAIGVTPGSGEALALQMTLERLLDDPALAKSIGRAGHSFVSENRSPERVARDLKAFFHEFEVESRALLQKQTALYESTRRELLGQVSTQKIAGRTAPAPFTPEACRAGHADKAAISLGWRLS